MNINKEKRIMKTNILCGILLITTGIMLEYGAVIPNSNALSVDILNTDKLNLNLIEIDTSYQKEEKKQEKKEEEVTPIPMTNVIDTSWGWPTSLNYGITSYFSSGHLGLDIVVYDGDYNVYSASSGVVVEDRYKWDGGNYFIIQQDNGYYVIYCHLNDKTVSLGQRVQKGQVIGHIGSSGYVTGPHLHFSVWQGYPYYGGYSINPYNFY